MGTIEFRLAEQDVVVLVETPVSSGNSGLERAGLAESVTKKATLTFEAALETIRPTAETIIAQFAAMSARPAEVSLSFGLKLTANTSAKIVSSGGEAHLDITVKWVPGQG